jgi:hypothetical protein
MLHHRDTENTEKQDCYSAGPACPFPFSPIAFLRALCVSVVKRAPEILHSSVPSVPLW